MPRRKLTSAQKWQVIGMRTTGLSLRRIAVHFGVTYSVISRLLMRHRESGTVDERELSGRPRKTSARDDRALSQSARRHPFTTARRLRENWEIHGRLSLRNVNRRLNCANLRARSPVKRPLLTLRHRQARHQWSRDHRNWTLRQWRRVHWSDESRVLLHHIDGRMRVWRPRNTAYREKHILGSTAFGGGGLTSTDYVSPPSVIETCS
ncbi:unnamed protein product [Mytilus edulis]|uniref:Transposase Tc1-like domain-containing protein n=1 Tax=Mytilus edulis TaxID=6550 RepID=A0A8S3UZM8_MYTED|nr:unnamed protein product [Mytilus edulis]